MKTKIKLAFLALAFMVPAAAHASAIGAPAEILDTTYNIQTYIPASGRVLMEPNTASRNESQFINYGDILAVVSANMVGGAVPVYTPITAAASGLSASENFGPVSSANFTSTATNLYEIDVWNKCPNDQFLILYNDTDTVAANAKKVYLLPAVDNLVLGLNEFGGSPFYFGTAFTAAISSTDNVSSYTAGDPQDNKISVRYK